MRICKLINMIINITLFSPTCELEIFCSLVSTVALKYLKIKDSVAKTSRLLQQ